MMQTLRQLWQRTSLLQRTMLVGVALACIGAAVLLVGWARKPRMVVLYAELEPPDAAKVVEKIREAGVAYELADGGTTIRVPEAEFRALRLQMAADGLPADSARGWGIFDDEKIGTSPFTQRVNLTRAIEGELAKSIRLMEGVRSARVHVVRPESSLLSGKTAAASATVVLRLRAGWRLTPGNVATIVHLVSGAVENLQPENVVVADSRGRLLSGDADNTLAKKAGTFLDYKSRVEEYLAGKAEDMLTLALGEHRASVRVDANIDTSTLSQTIETYDPERRVITKEQLESTSSTPTGGGEGAAAGSSSKTEKTLSEYLVSRTVENRSELPGKIASLSVAAFVDLSGGGGEGEEAAPQLAVADVEEIIRNAIGLREQDTLKVVETTFREAPASAAAGAPEERGWLTMDFMLEMARRFSLGVLVIGALLALRILRGPRRKAPPASEGAAALAGAPAGGGHLLPGAAGEDPALLRAQITHALQENPEEVKRLFLKWVESEKAEA
jgi:flagellar M-ring protein FliF